MQLETLKWLEDIRLAAESIQGFAAGRTSTDFGGDRLLRSGIERQFEIVGEALIQLRRTDPATAARISDYRQIIGFRHHLVHRYWDVRDEVVWGIVERDIPVLIREVRALLAEGDPQFENPPAAQPQTPPPVQPQEDQ